MLNFKKKYLKYKEKYLNLKKMIGGGIDATYTIDAINNKIILTYSTIDGVAHEIKYTINSKSAPDKFLLKEKLHYLYRQY